MVVVNCFTRKASGIWHLNGLYLCRLNHCNICLFKKGHTVLVISFLLERGTTQSTAASIPEIVWVLLCRNLLSYSSSPEASVRPKTVPFLNVLLSRWHWMQIWMYYQAAILSKLQRTLSYWVNAVLMAVSRTVHLVGHSSFKVVIGSSWLSVVVVMSANMPFEFPWLTKEHT